MSNAIPTLTKTCTKCAETKSLDGFYRQASGIAGRQSQCKDCFREYYRGWYAKNGDKQREASRRRVAADPQANRDRVRAWREANLERARESQRRNKKVRRERERAAQTVARIDHEALWVSQRGRCALCGELIDQFAAAPDPLSKSIDHIVPLSKGGLSVQENVQWTHLLCNNLKAASTPDVQEMSA